MSLILKVYDMVSMEQAERIAIDFVKKRKSIQSIEVNFVKPSKTKGGWLVKGVYKAAGIPLPYYSGFTVKIDKDGNVAAFSLEESL